MRGKLHMRSVRLAAMCGLFAAPVLFAQMPAPKAPAMPAVSSAPAADSAPRSMLDQAAKPPEIQLTDGKLTIQAVNSSLRAILDDLQQRTGTKVEGLSGDERIFGVYGPGNPQEVLAAVLDDSGYNVLIAGRKPDGSPREVVLSARAASATTPAAPQRTQAAEENEDDSGEAAPAQFVPPPQPVPAPTPGTPAQQPIKTPQQMLEELQRLRLGAAAPSGGATTPAPPQ